MKYYSMEDYISKKLLKINEIFDFSYCGKKEENYTKSIVLLNKKIGLLYKNVNGNKKQTSM